MLTTPIVPARKSGDNTSPNNRMATVTPISVRRRPRSARRAETGMVNAKHTTPMSCITRNCCRS
jgi:hypothetical protein